jgi:SEC-C motif domain protein
VSFSLEEEMQQCQCGSMLPRNMCCELYITGQMAPPTAEALMRSRYTAYTLGNSQYIFDTYVSEWKKERTIESFTKDFSELSWTGLEIIGIFEGGRQHETGEVEFVAHYEWNGQQMTVHERSLFYREDGLWRYHKARE